MMSGNGKGFALDDLFRSPFPKVSSDQVFLSVQSNNFFKGQWMNFFAFELYYSLFHILMIKNSYGVDRALFIFHVQFF